MSMLLVGLRKSRNAAKADVAPWWPECSKEAFNTGLDALASGAWRASVRRDTHQRTGPGCPAQPTGTRAWQRSAHPPPATGHAEQHWAQDST
ncbi:hypothetical protein [Micromonospora sp. CB01531]|uniref:hypothetical protein n=1 Tax=Micromonospora sp. CB01531 TaxID=1718947 RepID=UPI0013010C64|nr:hypothetical protein [Micromonospora sp. CB01531]